MKTIEIEKKFLVKEMPELNVEPIQMIDVYLPEETNHAHLRARKQNDKYELTKKAPINKNNSYKMLEQTIDLTKEEFDFLYSKSKRKIEKNRYKIPLGEVIIDLDVFEGNHKGLILAEVEFKDEETMKKFEKPVFFDKEVNHVELLAGGYLSGISFKEIKNQLFS
jgi:adenylate cyclase